jgi:exo-1,4-beta-D-glucosaminidase
VNQTSAAANSLNGTARIVNLDGTTQFTKTVPANAGPDSSQSLFALPTPAGLSPTYFVEVKLTDGAGKTVSTSVYWLSTKMDTLSNKSTWYYTATKQFADFTALSQLPQVQPAISSCVVAGTPGSKVRVTIANTSSSVAFFLEARLFKGPGGDAVLPIRWTANDITLMPGEHRTLTGAYRTSDLGGASPSVRTSGWNVPSSSAQPAVC